MEERNRNGEYDRHTFNPEKETHKGGEKKKTEYSAKGIDTNEESLEHHSILGMKWG